MNISLNKQSVLLQKPGGLKSTKEKLERQQKAQAQIEFFEKQKAGLKNMQCETLEEIEEKLALFQNYDAQISAVKSQYNHEQMLHCMDEAKELGEKLAKAAEKNKPKTEEERKCEQIEEALGTEDEGGMLTELLEELPDTEELTQEEIAAEEFMEEAYTEDAYMDERVTEEFIDNRLTQEELIDKSLRAKYRPIDLMA